MIQKLAKYFVYFDVERHHRKSLYNFQYMINKCTDQRVRNIALHTTADSQGFWQISLNS